MRAKNVGVGLAMALLVSCGGSGGGGGDGSGGSGGAGSPDAGDPGECTTRPLPFWVGDADYSTALARIVVLTGGPSIALFDPLTFAVSTIQLPSGPMSSLSLGPDGLSAAVSYDRSVAIVDLAEQRVTATIPTTTDGGDIVMGGNGFAYVFPRQASRADVHSIEIATATDHGNDATGQAYPRTVAKLHPSGMWMYGVVHSLSSKPLERFNITAGVVSGIGHQNGSDHPLCGDVWISPEGLDVFNGCGTV